MSLWAAIETAVRQRIEGLTLDASPLLAVVRGCGMRDRRLLHAALQRERHPAAYVIASGRDASDTATRCPGRLLLTVLLATRSHRSDQDARTGAVDIVGIFDVAERVAGALCDPAITDDCRLLLVEEKSLGADEGTVVWEQRYEVCRRASMLAPTFGGQALAGADSEVHVELGPLKRVSSAFSFPGIDGVFERHLGTRERPIVWRGQLRAADDAALNALESAIERELRDGREKTLVDPWSRTYERCVIKSYVQRKPRRRDELTGQSLQDFEIEFVQLDG